MSLIKSIIDVKKQYRYYPEYQCVHVLNISEIGEVVE